MRYAIFSSGSANISIQAKKHPQQYPHLWPFEAGMDQIAIEFEHLRYYNQSSNSQSNCIHLTEFKNIPCSFNNSRDRMVCKMIQREITLKLNYFNPVLCPFNTPKIALDIF